MKSSLLTITLIIVLIGAFVFLGNLFFGNTNSETLTSPVKKNILQTVGLQKTTPTPTPAPTIIKYSFNKSTDLKGELDSINPEVLDSDFDNLKQITTSL